MEHLTLQQLTIKTQEALEQAGASNYYKKVLKTVAKQLLLYSKEKDIHSFSMDMGITIIQMIAEKYNGYVDISNTDKQFRLSILLPLVQTCT